MDTTNETIKVTPIKGSIFSADKRRTKKALKYERIRSRIWELDFLRGLCVILMVFDHLMYDLGYIFGDLWFNAVADPAKQEMYMNVQAFADQYWNWTLRTDIVRPIVVLCFFLICGISCSFSRSNFKRGLILLVCSMLLTAVTTALGESTSIKFGVLHMLSISILVIAVIRAITRGHKMANAITSFVIGLVLIITEIIIQANVSTQNNFLCIFSSAYNANGGFYSADYFPLLPNVGYVLIGASMAYVLYPKRRTLFARLDTQFRWYRPINFFGRHAAFFYLSHQVIWVLLLGLYTIIAIPDGWNLLVQTFFGG